MDFRPTPPLLQALLQALLPITVDDPKQHIQLFKVYRLVKGNRSCGRSTYSVGSLGRHVKTVEVLGLFA